ncbi:hypothetical protein CDA63_09035 [Hymenobacter amundsenii]|uniref:Uncharacterized protein n=1 Tax=Hymenobacter amundsenii TaxID=2006685 RepID=A0A246FLB6_9BACT|nr:hypothetical protein [Hymenobacter amundsenii]OWP63510.1 hypothetical protein CDA63_09035 [Hymenobacter amundsenii]
MASFNTALSGQGLDVITATGLTRADDHPTFPASFIGRVGTQIKFNIGPTTPDVGYYNLGQNFFVDGIELAALYGHLGDQLCAFVYQGRTYEFTAGGRDRIYFTS